MARSLGAWREPATRIPLRWGTYRLRVVAAIVLIVAGGLLVQATSVYAFYFLPIGLAAHALGWLILPARGGRRVIAAAVSALAVAMQLTGSEASVLLVVPLAFWFLLRQRPATSYLATLLPLASGLILAKLFPQFGGGAIVVVVSLVVLVAAAWIGRSIAKNRRIFSQSDATRQ